MESKCVCGREAGTVVDGWGWCEDCYLNFASMFPIKTWPKAGSRVGSGKHAYPVPKRVMVVERSTWQYHGGDHRNGGG